MSARFAGALVGALLAAAFLFSDELGIPAPWRKADMVALGLLALLSPLLLMLAIVLHECGHVLAGFALRFNLLAVVVGPWTWEFHPRGFVFHWDRQAPYLRGFAFLVPNTFERLRPRVAIYLFGGPLASLLGILPTFIFPDSLPAFAFAVINSFLGPLNFLPFSSQGVWTDGARLLQLAQGGPPADRFVLLHILSAHLVGPDRFSSLPAELLDPLRDLHDDSIDALYGSYYLYLYETDAGRFRVASPYIEHCYEHREKLPAIFCGTMIVELLYSRAKLGEDVSDLLPEFATARPSSFLVEQSIERALAATLPPAEALPKIEAALRSLDHAPPTHDRRLERLWLTRDRDAMHLSRATPNSDAQH